MARNIGPFPIEQHPMNSKDCILWDTITKQWYVGYYSLQRDEWYCYEGYEGMVIVPSHYIEYIEPEQCQNTPTENSTT